MSEDHPVSIPRTTTPRFVIDLVRLRERLGSVRRSLNEAGVDPAYSLKTNSDPRVLGQARSEGYLAETINGAEVEAALAAGWSVDQIVMNGPAKLWRFKEGHGRVGLWICDRPEETREVELISRLAERVGVRLRASASSRFGFNLDNREDCAALRDAAETFRDVTLHCHLNSVDRGVEWWLAEVSTVFTRASSIPWLADSVVGVDVGGGWDADGLDALLDGGALGSLARAMHSSFPRLRKVLAEPGQSVVAGCGEVHASVVRASSRSEVVVDASSAELPFPIAGLRRVVHDAGGTWVPLQRGHAGTIFGRSCMESDVLATGIDVSSLRAGDRVIFCDAGAYDFGFRSPSGVAQRA